jgi:hypothetical protein
MSSIGVVVGLVAGSMSALTQHEPSMDRDESSVVGEAHAWKLFGRCLTSQSMVLVFPTSLNYWASFLALPDRAMHVPGSGRVFRLLLSHSAREDVAPRQ